MPASLSVSEKLLDELWAAQLRWAATLANEAATNGGTGDDGHDYLVGALDLASYLEDLRYDHDLARLDALLNTVQTNDSTDTLLDIYATDGIAPEIWKLNPPALEA
jgi:hypothetical protein